MGSNIQAGSSPASWVWLRQQAQSQQIRPQPSEIAGTRAIARDPGFSNVTLLSSSFEEFRMPEKLDLVWTAQNYHDLHDTFLGPPNVAALNKALFNSLKPAACCW